MSIWSAFLCFYAIARNSVQHLIPHVNSDKSRLVKPFCFFCNRKRRFSFCIFFSSWQRQHEILQLTFSFSEKQLSKVSLDGFHCELLLGYFFRHLCMLIGRNYVCIIKLKILLLTHRNFLQFLSISMRNDSESHHSGSSLQNKPNSPL